MIAPDKMSGDVVEALAAGDLFRLRGVLIGTVAFQTYSGILGVRLPHPWQRSWTGDVDVAQDYAISAEVNDSLPPILGPAAGRRPELPRGATCAIGRRAAASSAWFATKDAASSILEVEGFLTRRTRGSGTTTHTSTILRGCPPLKGASADHFALSTSFISHPRIQE